VNEWMSKSQTCGRLLTGVHESLIAEGPEGTWQHRAPCPQMCLAEFWPIYRDPTPFICVRVAGAGLAGCRPLRLEGSPAESGAGGASERLRLKACGRRSQAQEQGQKWTSVALHTPEILPGHGPDTVQETCFSVG
jgi:hypothetical protein